MKLELKHIASYLPYGLKCRVKGYDDFEVDGVSLATKKISQSDCLDSYDLELTFKVSECKPILRPLSDLAKEIDGVVHLDVIKEIYPNVPNFYSLLRTKTLDLFALCDTIVEYCVVQYLFQHHFDVYGLIEEGLAVDINTIENV